MLRKALWRTQGGESVVLQYDSRADDETAFSFGLGCNGLVELLLERLEASGPNVLDFLERGQTERVAVALATVVVTGTGQERVGARVMRDARGRTESTVRDEALRALLLEDLDEALASGRSGYRSREAAGGVVEVAIEVVQPPVPLVLYGTGFDVHPVVELARNVGWHVTVVASRPTSNLPARFPRANAWTAPVLDARTLAVLMTHNFHEDEALLTRLLSSPVRFIGVLGPRRRTERLLEALGKQGVRPTAEQLSRLYGPMGLDIGAEGPDEIALSIVSELRAFLSGREGGSLRRRTEPIHAAAEPFTARSLALPAENVLQAQCAVES